MTRKFALALLTLAFLAACGPAATPAPTAFPATPVASTATAAALALTDGLGRSVTLAGPAQHVVSLAQIGRAHV
jgi:ABC-type Fe3+-hydroxamate transport system substrate-binding protein